MGQLRLQATKEAILELFTARGDEIYSRFELTEIFRDLRTRLRLGKNTKVGEFLALLETHGRLKHVAIRATAPYAETINRYVWGDVSTLRLAAALRRSSYLSHGTALALHGIADGDYQTIYVNDEQRPKPNGGPLTQEAIQLAFSRPQRTSKLNFVVRDCRVVVINGKHTGRLGVEDLIGPPGEKLACTNLERTLIDIVVRPSYAGGATQVARAYRNAMHRVSVTRLCAILNELAYAYPYHQAIGFLMQHVGYPPHAHELLRAIPSEFDFYLEHDLRDPAYNSYWKIYFPRDLSPTSASNH